MASSSAASEAAAWISRSSSEAHQRQQHPPCTEEEAGAVFERQKEGQRRPLQFRGQGEGAASHGQTARQFHDGEIAAARQMFQNVAQGALLRVARIRLQAKAADASREQIRRTQEFHPYAAGIQAGLFCQFRRYCQKGMYCNA